MARVGVIPLDGPGAVVVLSDVVHELAAEIVDEVKTPRWMRSRSIVVNQSSTWLSQDE